MEHGLRDCMLMHIFYRGLSENSRVFLDNECEGSSINTTAANTHILLDGLLLEVKIKESLKKAQVPEDVFGDVMKYLIYIIKKEKLRKLKCLVKSRYHCLT